MYLSMLLTVQAASLHFGLFSTMVDSKDTSPFIGQEGKPRQEVDPELTVAEPGIPTQGSRVSLVLCSCLA